MWVGLYFLYLLTYFHQLAYVIKRKRVPQVNLKHLCKFKAALSWSCLRWGTQSLLSNLPKEFLLWDINPFSTINLYSSFKVSADSSYLLLWCFTPPPLLFFWVSICTLSIILPINAALRYVRGALYTSIHIYNIYIYIIFLFLENTSAIS